MNSTTILLFLADVILATHFAFVLFAVVGQLLILAGWLGNWHWVRNAWFRFTHLGLVIFVMIEDWLQVACPLTVAERWLRHMAQAPTYDKSFIAHWLGKLQRAFIDAPHSTFVVISTVFGVLVIVSFLLYPPRVESVQPPESMS